MKCLSLRKRETNSKPNLSLYRSKLMTWSLRLNRKSSRLKSLDKKSHRMSPNNLIWRAIKDNSIAKSPRWKTRFGKWKARLRIKRRSWRRRLRWTRRHRIAMIICWTNWWSNRRGWSSRRRNSRLKLTNCRRNLIKLRMKCRTLMMVCRLILIHCCIATLPSRTIPSTKHWHHSSTPNQRKREWRSCSWESQRASTSLDPSRFSSKLRKETKCAWKSAVASCRSVTSLIHSSSKRSIKYRKTTRWLASKTRRSFSRSQLSGRRAASRECQSCGGKGPSRRYQGSSRATTTRITGRPPRRTPSPSKSLSATRQSSTRRMARGPSPSRVELCEPDSRRRSWARSPGANLLSQEWKQRANEKGRLDMKQYLFWTYENN